MNALAKAEAAAAGPVVRHRVFLLEIADEPDAVLRVLGPLAVQQVGLNRMEMRRAGAVLSLRLETAGLDDDRAALIARRLQGMPVVRSLCLGWSASMARAESP